MAGTFFRRKSEKLAFLGEKGSVLNLNLPESDVVDPLFSTWIDEPLLLAWVVVIALGPLLTLSTVDPANHPPVTFNLVHASHCQIRQGRQSYKTIKFCFDLT